VFLANENSHPSPMHLPEWSTLQYLTLKVGFESQNDMLDLVVGRPAARTVKLILSHKCKARLEISAIIGSVIFNSTVKITQKMFYNFGPC
jgi:hypothetical protein